MAKLILWNGRPMIGNTLLGNIHKPMFTSGSTPDPSCCCPGECGCCSDDFTPPVPDVVLTFESTDCPAIDGLNFPLIFDDDVSLPSDTACWRGVLTGPVIGDSECFQATYTLCCCDNEPDPDAFCLSVAPTIAAGCILTPLTIVELVSCTCDPFELVFRAVVGEVLPGFCLCCTPGDEIFIRITL